MARQTLTTIINRHQVYLERLKASYVLDFDKVFVQIEKAIREVMSKLEIDTLDQLTKADLTGLLRELKIAQTAVQTQALFGLTENLKELSGSEAQFEASTLKACVDAAKTGHVVTAATATQAYARALAHPMSDGVLMKDWLDNWSTRQVKRIEGVVRDGWAQGKTVQQMMQQVRGTKARNYKDGIISTSRHEAATIVRTSTQHVAQQARMETWAKNDDLVQGYSILATLDGVTSAICRSLDGEKFEMGKGPFPPLHPNCRSTTIPELGPEFDFLDEGATRSSANGYVDANTTYYDWLKTQPRPFVNDAIGPDRAKLFMDGNMTTQQFKDLNLGKNFEPLTLREMAARSPRAFEDTGLFEYIDKDALPDDVWLAPPPVKVAPTVSTFRTLEDRADVLDVLPPYSMTEAQQEAIRLYTDGTINNLINQELRSTGVTTLKTGKAIQKALEKAPPVSEDINLFRGMRDFTPEEAAKMFKPGTVVTDPAILSASVLEEQAFEGFKVRIEVPKGSKGVADISHLSFFNEQAEVLINGGRFEVISFSPKEAVLRYLGPADQTVDLDVAPVEIPVAPEGAPARQPLKVLPAPATNHFKTNRDLDNYWYEYENASDVNAYVEGYEQYGTPQVIEAVAKMDELTQERTNYKTLYRGMVLENEEALESMFPQGQSIKLNRFSASATNTQLAELYTDPQFIGLTDDDNPVRVLLEFKSNGPRGLKGHLSRADGWDGDESEVVLPRNQAYEVVEIIHGWNIQGHPGVKVILKPRFTPK